MSRFIPSPDEAFDGLEEAVARLRGEHGTHDGLFQILDRVVIWMANREAEVDLRIELVLAWALKTAMARLNETDLFVVEALNDTLGPGLGFHRSYVDALPHLTTSQAFDLMDSFKDVRR